MVLSTPPPPLDAAPSSSTTNRPPFPPDPQNPTPHSHSNPPSHYPAPPFYSPHLLNSILPSNCNPNYPHPQDDAATASARHYAVASSCRGFLPKQPPSVTLINLDPNSHIYMCRPGGASYPKPVFGYSHHPDPGQGPGGLGMGMGMGMGYVSGRATTHLQHPGAAAVMPGVIKGVPVSGASSQSQHLIALSSTSISDCNGQKEIRDDSVVTMKDWKVRMSDNASVYALCRSWLRNGLSEESQPVYMDAASSLPRPLPLPAQDSISPLKKEDAKEEKDQGSVENLTPEELLQTHIKRAKKVRLRLREKRLQRIARYKTRLALLLPPMAEQQLRHDSASGI